MIRGRHPGDPMFYDGDMAMTDDGDRVLFSGRVKAFFGNSGGKSDMQ